MIELFIRILVIELGLKMKTVGSTMLNREDLDRGAEPEAAAQQDEVKQRTTFALGLSKF